MQQVAVNVQHNVIGEAFGVRGCASSCSCNPCDCNPCTCGSDSRQVNYPHWRIHGYALQRGSINHVDIAQHMLISLAQPQDENVLSGAWVEALLVDELATEAQIQALLMLFENQLHSLPAEIGVQPLQQRAVYRAPMRYSRSGQGPSLSLSFQPDERHLVRKGECQEALHAWEYQGPLVLREILRYHNL